MAEKKEGKEPKNAVHQNAIMVETIKKENFHQKLYTNYGVNPFRRLHTLAPKPNAPPEDLSGITEEDSHFVGVIERAHLEPTKKYTVPQTESQEIGWITKPLLETNKADSRLYFPKNSCEITKYMDAYWRCNIACNRQSYEFNAFV
uniref:Protein FAM183A n=1 Tax=Macrostomum lignano TaxID=282301 RepID=A0A1I8GTU3_9PLAT